MSIFIPSKSQKTTSTLVDCFRVLAWQHYKSSYKDSELKGLELYEEFKEGWLEHEIHKMDLKSIQKFIKEMGYTEEELLEIRSDYYEQKANYQPKGESTESKVSQMKSKVSQMKSKYQESDSEYDPKPF